MRGVRFIGQEELCAADGSRRHILAVVAGVIPAAADIEAVAFLVELVCEVYLCLAILRMAIFVADLEVIRLARADAKLVGALLVEGAEVRLAQRLF